jgi:hypothetical protein
MECVKLTLVLNLDTALIKTPGLLVCTTCVAYHKIDARQLHSGARRTGSVGDSVGEGLSILAYAS